MDKARCNSNLMQLMIELVLSLPYYYLFSVCNMGTFFLYYFISALFGIIFTLE